MPDSEIVADPNTWTVRVTGCQSEGELTLADLKLLPTKTVASVLQCSETAALSSITNRRARLGLWVLPVVRSGRRECC